MKNSVKYILYKWDSQDTWKIRPTWRMSQFSKALDILEKERMFHLSRDWKLNVILLSLTFLWNIYTAYALFKTSSPYIIFFCLPVLHSERHRYTTIQIWPLNSLNLNLNYTKVPAKQFFELRTVKYSTA